MYALKVLREHGMDDVALQTIYRSVVIAKLQYASSAWWGFTNEPDRQRVRRCARCNFAWTDLGSFGELCRTTDERLFDIIAGNKHHVLHHLLPPKSKASYARFPAIGNTTQRNATQRAVTQRAVTQRCAQRKNSVTQRNASAVTALRKRPQANRTEFYFFRSPKGRQPIRGANSNDVVVIITSWRVRAHGNFDLRCVALRYLLPETAL